MALAMILLLGLLPGSVAGSGDASRFEVDAGGGAQVSSSVPGRADVAALLEVGAAVFVRPVRDDATPLPLQPFLQRSGTVRLDLHGAVLTAAPVALAGAIEASADVYAARWLAFTASLGTAGARAIDGSGDPAGFSALRVSAGAGLRAGDLRLDLAYRYAPGADLGPLPGRAALRGDGAVAIAGRAVLLEHIDLRLDLAVSFAGDLAGGFSSDYFATRRLGLLFGVLFGHGVLQTRRDAPVEDLFGARFGLSFWWSPRIALAVVFLPAWHFYAQGGVVEQRLLAVLSTRL